MHMYSVVISTCGGLFIISLSVIKIKIDSRCRIEGHLVPHPIRVLSLILFQMGCHGNHKLAKYSHFVYNFLLNMSYFCSYLTKTFVSCVKLKVSQYLIP